MASLPHLICFEVLGCVTLTAVEAVDSLTLLEQRVERQ